MVRALSRLRPSQAAPRDPAAGAGVGGPAGTSEPGLSIATARLALLFGAALAGASVLARVGPDAPAAWAASVILSAWAVAVAPGALLLLVVCGRRGWTLVEVLGLGLPVTAGAVAAFTILSLSLHIPVRTFVRVVQAWNVAALAWLWLRSRREDRVTIPAGELLLIVGLAALGWAVYAQGSPVTEGEDMIHIGIVRRLAALDAPALDNIYFLPGIIYTYPFPATHYLMSMISRFGDIDPLFLYYKLRVLWAPAAAALVYLGARAVFGSTAVALASGTAAVALALAGAFATVPGFFWGQLAAFSHASDVAMAVLLPGLLVVTFYFLNAGGRRDLAFFAAATGGMVVMVTLVHIREIVQYLVYVGAYTAFLVVRRRRGADLARAAACSLLAAAFVAAYVAWHGNVVSHVDALVSDQRDVLVQLARGAPLGTLLGPSLPLLDPFVEESWWPMFFGYNPLVLAVAPVVLLAWRSRALVSFVAASVLAYVLVVRVAAVAIAYIYLTYFEILYTPVRNLIFFIHLLAGVALYVAAAALSRDSVVKGVLGGTAGGIAVGLCWHAGTRPALEAHQSTFFLILLGALLAVLALMLRSQTGEAPDVDSELDAEPAAAAARAPGRRVRVATACVLVACVGVLWGLRTYTGTASRVISVRWVDELPDEERARLEQAHGLLWGERRAQGGNNWNYELVDVSPRNIQAIVTSPRVVDTHGLDRRQFTVDATAPRGRIEKWLNDRRDASQDRLLLWLATASLLGLAAWVWTPARRPLHLPSLAARPGPAWIWAFLALLVPAAALAWTPALSPLRAFGASEPRISTPAALLASLPCRERTGVAVAVPSPDANREITLPYVQSCAPSAAVIRWVDRSVPADAVLAVSRWNEYWPTLFMPQQVVTWGGLFGFLGEERLAPAYYQFYGRSLRRYGDQPFFNPHETRAERLAFVRALNVTHVLVDPFTRETMRTALDRDPDAFVRRFDDGRWMIYEVRR